MLANRSESRVCGPQMRFLLSAPGVYLIDPIVLCPRHSNLHISA